MVGAVIGWFFLGLLALLVLLLAVPVTIRVCFQNGALSVKVRVLFVRLTVFPMKPRKPKKEKAKKKKKDPEGENEPEKKEKKKRSFGELYTLIKRLAKAGIAAMKVFLRHLRITGVRVVVPVHAEDAGDTAIRCGQLQMAVGTVRAVLQGRLKVRYKQLEIIPDFAGQRKGELLLAAKLVFCPGIALIMGIVFLKTFLASKPRRYSKADIRRAKKRKRAAVARANGPKTA